MDTLEFLRTILPDEGYYYVVLISTNGTRHIPFTSLEEMAKAIKKYDDNPKHTVYHACSSYKERCVVDENGKNPKYRIQTNQHRAKSLWVDIDCGQEKADAGKGYLKKLDACQAVQQFCVTTGLPLPMVVDSGNGIHCYWPLTKSLKAATWQVLATGLKQALMDAGVLIDPTVTADFARILRPPGTTNRKYTPKPVVVKQATNLVDPAAVQQVLLQLVGTVKTYTPTLITAAADSINDDLTAHLAPHMPSSAELAAEGCAQLALMRDTKGDVEYEHWRGVIGIIKHCTEGLPLAEAWTENRAATGHSSVDTKTRYDTWSAGPTTCEFFAKLNPTACDGCAYNGKIKSPIVLGRVIPEDAPEPVQVEVDGTMTLQQVPPMPKGYRWEKGVLVRFMKDSNDVWQPHPFCQTLFYPVYRMHRDDGTYSLGLQMHLPNARTRKLEVDTGLLASPAKLMEALGHSGEIMPTNNKDASTNMTAYLRDFLENMKKTGDELNTMSSFGWKNDMQDFLLGDRLYRSDGTMRRTQVGGVGMAYLDHFPEPKGSAESYSKALNDVFNRPGMECLQYAIASGFGSILTSFGEDDYHGLMVCLTGGDTGKGKTSACVASLYAFGDAQRMTIASEKGTTANAFYSQLGVYSSIPMLMDEYTNIKPEELSEYCYSISSGKDKKRMYSTARGVRAIAHTYWRLSPFVTTNKDLHAILSTHTANSQAEAVRLIQIKVDEYAIPTLPEGQVPSAMAQMRQNMGSAGEVFIKHVVANRDEMFTLYRETIARLGEDIPGPKYRFYRNQGAATLTALRLLNTLGIAEFDFQKLFDFTVKLMQKLCDEVTEHNTVTPETALNQMLNELGPRILTTVEYRDSREARGPERVPRINQTIAGRYIQGNSTNTEPLAGRLYLVKKEMRDWCMKHRIEPGAVLDYATKNGLYIAETMFTITRGTENPMSNQRCIVFDMNKLSGMLPHSPKLTVHVGGAKVASGVK